jgi:peptidoglycan-associated lipoprotein
MSTFSTSTKLAVLGFTLLASACSSYVKRDEFNTTVSELRGADKNINARLDALDGLMRDLQTKVASHDAAIVQLEGRIRIDLTTHFGFDDASLSNADKPALQDFASVIQKHHANVVITVEGFTDPAGSAAYNATLGKRRADAVRNYLLGTGALAAEKLRSVSYGEATNRQIVPGAWGAKGRENRRVALVIDFVPVS